MSKTLIKAFTDKAGTAISLSTATTSDGLLQKKENSIDIIIPSGYSMLHQDMIVSTGTTVTIEANAHLTSFNELIIDGDLVIDGDLDIQELNETEPKFDSTLINKTITDLTVPSGYSSMKASPVLLNTLTIDSNADFVSVGDFTIQGTLDVSGTLTFL